MLFLGNDGVSIPATVESPRSSDDEEDEEDESNLQEDESLLMSITRESFPDDQVSTQI